jgi:peroxiredoxin (alkyl hydroperoxide reductase subunit C)
VAVEVGQEAPDFTLKGPGGEPVTLSFFRGRKNVVLMFYPLAFSGVCTRQLTAVAGNETRYAGEDAQVLGVSVDSHHAQSAFASSLGLRDAILLGDFAPKGDVARAYGVYNDAAECSHRATFVIDKGGIVRRAEVAPPGELPDEDAAIAALATCNV